MSARALPRFLLGARAATKPIDALAPSQVRWLGALLIAVSFAYSRYREKLSRFL